MHHSTNDVGTLGELKAMQEFIKLGFSIYSPLSGKELYDFIACQADKLIKVQVKSTAVKDKYGSYSFKLKSIRPNRTRNKIIKFDNSVCDILALYIVLIDQVCFMKSSDVKAASAINLRESKVNSKTNLISDYNDLSILI